MAGCIPGVEIANNGNAGRVGRPYGKADTGLFSIRCKVRAKSPVALVMRPLSMQVKFKRSQQMRSQRGRIS